MATVCRAKKRGPAGFERSVALKRMLSHLSEDQSFVESFIREAKVSSLLVHPNVAQVYDFGRINGIYYIAMELVPGFDLRKLLRYANRANESIPLAVVLRSSARCATRSSTRTRCLDEQGVPLQDRASRYLAVEHHRRAHRSHEGDRLRHREGEQPPAPHRERAGQGQARLHVARGGARHADRAGVRRVLDGRGRVGARHRVAAVLGAHGLRDHAEDPRGRGRAAVDAQPGVPARSRSA